MKIRTETCTLPAYWAPYLMNGDATGYDGDEIREMRDFMKNRPYLGEALGCSENPEYKTRNDANNFGCDCLDFSFPVKLYEKRGDLFYLIYPGYIFESPLEWQKRGLRYTASGYGKKIPTPRKIRIFKREYRIYCTTYSNVGLCWINLDGKKVIIE